jgi:aspartyl-tRNA synthetase
MAALAPGIDRIVMMLGGTDNVETSLLFPRRSRCPT